MTLQELLNPRYKVIADYPGSNLQSNDILIQYTFPETGNYCYLTNRDIPLLGKNKRKEEVELYPHLFRKLYWYEARDLNDLPLFIKMKGKAYRVEGWSKNIFGGPMPLGDYYHYNTVGDTVSPAPVPISISIEWHFFAHESTPITEEEYNVFEAGFIILPL